MKVAIVLLYLLPLAFAEKRELLGNILNGGQIQNLITSVIRRYGIHANVWQCEKECLELFTNHILDLGCDFTCKGIQSLIQHHLPTTHAVHPKITTHGANRHPTTHAAAK
ncbi:uncharacterized protein [Haliotis cracherodii]|uniref:uncharacterized protein isoform X2 n=1 Tax=Haliotis cracherodii TaxID=6455 RepID=UPI0039EC4606